MNQLLDRMNRDFQNEETKYAYADAVVNAFVSEQIKALREDRKLSQEELADLIGTKQSGVSRLERADYSAWKVETLRKLARAFGVRLRISFEEFGTLVNDVAGFNERNLLPRSFTDDPAFREPRRADHRKPRFRSSGKGHGGFRRRRKASPASIPKKPAGHSGTVPILVPRAVMGLGHKAEQVQPAPCGYSQCLGNNVISASGHPTELRSALNGN